MPREYWLIVDRPLFKRFPFLLRKKVRVGQVMEYYEACDRYVKAKEKLPPRWKISLGVTSENGIVIL